MFEPTLALTVSAPHAAVDGGKHAILTAAVVAMLLLGAFAPRLAQAQTTTVAGPPVTAAQFDGDLSKITFSADAAGNPPIFRPRLRGPASTKVQSGAGSALSSPRIGPLAAMPGPLQNFRGLSHDDVCVGGQCGGRWPPDPNGDVGPNHYVIGVNNAIGIYSKTGTLLASFTENNLWSGAGLAPCTGNSQGDPVVLYDQLADRWVLTWFAFATSAGDPVAPFFQCIAASKTNDPVAGGYWLYAVRMDPGGAGPPNGNLNDYSKFGLWHDCLYLSANEFAGETYTGAAYGSFSRTNMYSGAPLTYALGYIAYNVPLGTNLVFSMVPSNNNGSGANAVQPGRPNYYVSESLGAFAFEVRKFTAGANCGAGGTFSAPIQVSQTSYPALKFGSVVPQPNTSILLDNIDDRIMQKVQYRKVAGSESLWVTHNVDTALGQTAMQWAQINVTGDTVTTTPVQQQIYTPDTALNRWMGSIAADNQGNVALGYSTSSGLTPNFPSIAYSGRLATDPPNTLPQTEVQLIAGGGSQTNNCGGGPCDRWGDYTAMAIDPSDDCTFWYVNQYYDTQASGTSGNWSTRIGSFKYPTCNAPSQPVASLVYKPLEPCRIMDTRSATPASGVQGPIAGNVLYGIPGFITGGQSWSQYGGSATDCGLTSPPGNSIHALALVATILNPNFDAYLGISDVGTLSSVLSNVALNYTHGQGLSTMYIVPQIGSNSIYFAMPAGLSAHLIYDVVGYFVVADATALQCTTQSSAPTSIAATNGTGSATSPACGAGFSLTAGSCDSTAAFLNLAQDKAAGGNTTWFCSAINRGGSAANLTARATCCRVPGK
ncbi:MAG: hypothetical protein ABI537_15460 [Casimicrobiaceae bacterium]